MEQENLENEQETILDETPQEVGFEDLGLAPEVLEAVKAAGYETPSPIQAKAIPALLQGKNLLGTAQTGTGKTAAFALPLLSRIEFNGKDTSLLVLTPTRELSIQVAEAIQQYAMKLPKVHVVPVYGGQDIAVQFKALKRAANVIVATPGRLIDHLKRGSIVLDKVQAVVLDEADEMLDMGFMEDVETILSKIPENAQRALFSATMPKEVIEIIDEHLGEYSEARIEGKTTTVENIRQRFLLVKSHDKMEALARVIEGEDFVKGKTVTRTLFRYDVLDNTVDADGNIKITGKHTQCSDISDVLRKRMMENGISARELAAFTMKKEGANDVD